jgi:transglutaminase-like putative cysteine protease
LKERLVSQALYDWTRTHITYNSWLANQRNDRNVRKHYWNAEELFTFNRLTAVCAGISDVMLKMARSLGINAMKVDGFARTDFDSTKLPLDPSKVWHSWVLVRQADGFVFPADSTIGGVGLERARTLKGVIPRGFTNPSTGLDWLLYLTIYYPSQTGGRPIPPEFAVSRMSYSDWLNLDITGMRQSYSGLTRPIYAASAIETEQPTQHLGG